MSRSTALLNPTCMSLSRSTSRQNRMTPLVPVTNPKLKNDGTVQTGKYCNSWIGKLTAKKGCICYDPFCRCQCGECEVMPTNRECICCSEVETVVNKFQESANDINCITHHEGFDSVCLNVWVLQTAYFSYRHQYGEAEEKTVHE